jgi:hypothetical protein
MFSSRVTDVKVKQAERCRNSVGWFQRTSPFEDVTTSLGTEGSAAFDRDYEARIGIRAAQPNCAMQDLVVAQRVFAMPPRTGRNLHLQIESPGTCWGLTAPSVAPVA